MTPLVRLRFLTAGESHGPKLTAILEGFPAGFALDLDAVQAELARRQRGFGAGGRMKIERDRARITGGFMGGRTTGGPLAFEIENRDWANWAGREIPPMTKPRPGHADLTGALKYGHGDLRLALERASARETAARVAVGAVCKQALRALGVEVGGYVTQIGDVRVPLAEEATAADYARRIAAADNDLACPVPEAEAGLRDVITRWRKERDTLGGVFEVVALGLAPGLGSYVHYDRRLDARVAFALLSIQAMKGVEIGPAFANAGRRGTEVHDAICAEEGRLRRRTNRAGGVEGGVTTGEPLVARVAMKPISTTLNPRETVDLASGEAAETTYERSDFCALPRAVPIGEAMLSLVLLDAVLESLGGDRWASVVERWRALPRGELERFELDDRPWWFGYDA